MKPKYEKPIARNMGEMLPNAEGYCVIMGNSANQLPPVLDCIQGTGAVGAICDIGGFVNPYACQEGMHPAYFGCLPGTGAASPCTAGTGVY